MELMVQYAMLPNIIDHSIQVMRVSLAIVDNLKSGITISRDLVVAAALLHDITKTRSLSSKERHEKSGGELLRDMGLTCIAEIVEQHVHLPDLDPLGKLEEREIVYYADKRVMHDRIVSIEERYQDLMQRYGIAEDIRTFIFQNQGLALTVENKINSFMVKDIHCAIQAC
ncbi:MAG: hypothetical protein CSYNP_01176 [Syntrophus sp. SKADARSKE-3]|nr:hypothetical protein [Syntrophus sp. SKADARSKE-3]